jgi:hypothetical protein
MDEENLLRIINYAITWDVVIQRISGKILRGQILHELYYQEYKIEKCFWITRAEDFDSQLLKAYKNSNDPDHSLFRSKHGAQIMFKDVRAIFFQSEKIRERLKEKFPDIDETEFSSPL